MATHVRSTSGAYYIALDHVRALAAFIVIAWHFVHGTGGYPVPFEGAPRIIPLAILDEGHTGVALFMCLSGYLFAKLLAERKIKFHYFFLNRCLRLLPLLILVCLVNALLKLGLTEHTLAHLKSLWQGIYKPILPNGGWSITVEFHFYLLISLFIALAYSNKYLLVCVVSLPILIRLYIQQFHGDVQYYSYFTLFGRFDQFFFGILAYRFRSQITARHGLAFATTLLFILFYYWFDKAGGFYQMPNYPSNRMIWIIIPAIEALSFSLLISWYDNSFKHSTGRYSRLIAQFGEYSYSFYLLHFFFVFKAADFIHTTITPLSNFYIALFFSFVFYLCIFPLGYLSYRFIESPFMRFRRKYVVN